MLASTPPPLRADQALFLDFDGTLVDLAPAPDRIRVEPELVALLDRVHQRLGGALALLSGRAVGDIDRWLSPLKLPVAGVHGAERRRADGSWLRRGDAALQQVLRAAHALAREHPGVRIERKPSAVAVHYREAPGAAQACRQALLPVVEASTELTLLPGKCVYEVLPADVGKGRALAAFMTERPFAGRTAVFVGDDVTDEAGFAEVLSHGGVAVKVGDGESRAPHRLAGVEAVKQWLAALVTKNTSWEQNHDARPA